MSLTKLYSKQIEIFPKHKKRLTFEARNKSSETKHWQEYRLPEPALVTIIAGTRGGMVFTVTSRDNRNGAVTLIHTICLALKYRQAT